MGTDKQRSPWTWPVVIALLWLIFAQTLGAARSASITFDEGPHLAVGYATLRTGDLRLQPVHIHPPLANVLAAAPLLLNPDLPDPREISGWEIASLSAITDAVVWQYPKPASLALSGRLPIILITMLVGVLVFRWATDLGGAKAGMLALGLYALDPNIIAHGSLITTDMAVTAWGFLTFFLLHRFGRHPNRARLVGIGLGLGMALSSKVSAVLLLLLVGMVLLVKHWRHPGMWQQGIKVWLAIVIIALTLLWAVYGFELRPIQDISGSIPLPAATHLKIYRSLQQHYRLGHPAFIAGQNSDQGWWFYFPVAFMVKTPLPTLILLGLALAIALRRRCLHDPSLTLFPLVYVITALFSSVDIGYRHLLPILPFMYVFIGHQLRPGESRELRIPNLQHIFLGGLLLWLAVGQARALPHPLSFFNELAGGPDGGYRWLVDSNLDWGQNLWQLRDWMRAEGVEQVYYSHFVPARPEVYGVNAAWLPPHPRAVPFTPFEPAPGVYVIGATTLQGAYTPEVNTFAYFRSRQPDAVLGHALFVYRVVERPGPDWAAVCSGFPLNGQQIRAGFGQPDLRLIFYDCAQSQVYAGGNEGRYLLPGEIEPQEGTPLVLHARQDDGSPAYSILRSGERPSPGRTLGQTEVEGPLTFLGFDLDDISVRPGQEFILKSFWQVKQTPGRPLSLMAHLVEPGGRPIAVGDGLGIPAEQWHPGDVIVQHHRFLVPEDAPAGEHWLQTGAYWLDTQERWKIHRSDGTISDHLLLDKIAILD